MQHVLIDWRCLRSVFTLRMNSTTHTHTQRERRPDLFRTLDSFLFSFPGESLQHEQRWKAIAPAGGVGVN